jgi:hypothetical protein
MQKNKVSQYIGSNCTFAGATACSACNKGTFSEKPGELLDSGPKLCTRIEVVDFVCLQGPVPANSVHLATHPFREPVHLWLVSIYLFL